VGFILFIGVAGFLVKSTHRQAASQHHVLAVQMHVHLGGAHPAA
jgi:hypothetical protein